MKVYRAGKVITRNEKTNRYALLLDYNTYIIALYLYYFNMRVQCLHVKYKYGLNSLARRCYDVGQVPTLCHHQDEGFVYDNHYRIMMTLERSIRPRRPSYMNHLYIILYYIAPNNTRVPIKIISMQYIYDYNNEAY